VRGYETPPPVTNIFNDPSRVLTAPGTSWGFDPVLNKRLTPRQGETRSARDQDLHKSLQPNFASKEQFAVSTQLSLDTL
jgi:predicted HAD superfamily Cof-like phosphohydrolase